MENGSEVKLTGDQVKFIRTMVGETQVDFARRFAVSQVTIGRIESKGAEVNTGPEIILIDAFAKKYGIYVPDSPVSRDPATGDLVPVSA